MNQRINPIQTAHETFERDRYVVVKGFLPPVLTQFAYRYATMRLASGLLDTNDAQMPGTPSAYADTFMETLMEMSLPHVSQVVGLELLPTYSYFRIYRQGDLLKPHIDRPACEISVTICLGFNNGDQQDPDYRWPIYMDGSLDYRHSLKKANAMPLPNEGTGALLNPGDAVIYRGCEAKHWREAFPGDHHAQVFIHYVDKNGPYAENRFDKRPALGLGAETISDRSPQPYFPNKKAVAQCSCGSNHPTAECCGRPGIAGRVTPLDPSLGPAILPPELLIVDEYLSTEACNRLVQYADQQAGVPAPVGDPSQKGFVGNTLISGFIADRIRVDLDQDIRQECLNICTDVCRNQIGKVLNVDMQWFELPHLLRYGPGGMYGAHSDAENWDPESQSWIKGIDRDYSSIIYLNSEFSGGALSFPNYNLRLHPRPGMLVCFPSDHRFVHHAEEVKSGLRYAMVTWGAMHGAPRVPGGSPNHPITL
ncbi:2OG-Fe(II) oxygenase [Pseudomonadota bacterium]